MDSLAILALAIVLCLSLFTISKTLRSQSDDQTRYTPEPTNRWPVIGHLPVLAGPELPHRALAGLADKYGPVFALRLGINRVLVVSSSEIAKELFTTSDMAAISRPAMTASRIFSYNFAMSGLGPYGDYWREMRKITVLELLSTRRTELLRRFRESEVQKSINHVYKLVGDNPEIELKKWIGDLSLNLMLRVIAGKSSSASETLSRFKNAVRELFHYMGMFVVGDALPFLGWMDIGGHQKAMKRFFGELDGYLQEWLVEHKKNRADKTEHDFMDVLLSVLDGESLHGYDSDTIIKATSLSMIAGGTDTSTVTVTWAIALLLNNRHVLRKAQEELDSVVSKERAVTEGDIEKLVYLQAIVKETMRLYPPAPLLAAREFVRDCDVAGYRVRKGTWLMVNAWKIQNDPSVWPDPTRFDPERFLTTQYRDIDVKGQNFELLPFGSGRRACPGMNLGLQMVHLTLASFLHAFEFSTVGDKPVDMTESFGFTNMKATPLLVVAKRRVSPGVYA